MLEYHKTTEAEKYIISDWKYEGEYALYNKAPYEEDKRTGRGFANTKNKCNMTSTSLFKAIVPFESFE